MKMSFHILSRNVKSIFNFDQPKVPNILLTRYNSPDTIAWTIIWNPFTAAEFDMLGWGSRF